METLEKAMEIAGFNIEEKKKVLRRKLEQLESVEADINTQVESAELLSGKKRKKEVSNWLNNVARVREEAESIEREAEIRWSITLQKRIQNKIEEVQQLVERGGFHKGFVLDAPDDSINPLLAPELVGHEFQVCKDRIWECLVEDEVFSIGIYGMGGVGKTTLIIHIHNEILERQNLFHCVYWITLSQDCSISKLQSCIAKAIGFDLSGEDDEKKRAAKLSKALIQRQKFVLILDDLWSPFSLEKVGIPDKMKQCKLILATRSLDVCLRMGCQRNFKIKPLSDKESWDLFKEKLGETLVPEFKSIAKSIVRECAGLPLGIVTIAGCMRGVDDIFEWRNALRELQDPKVNESEMQYEIFQVLKFSYSRLTDLSLQQCFLYCALYPEDYKIKREDLIEYMIVEGVIKGKSREAEYDKGHTMLNRLEKLCLLESVMERGHKCVKMHDLIRDMAIHIMKLDSKAIVKADMQLSEMPDCGIWTEDLVRISLMYNNILEIHACHSPKCPNLSTLLLRGNHRLRSIADSFFNRLHGLVVLDLSNSDIDELPGSISHLVNLNALLLSECKALKRMPSLANLREMKKLDLSYSGIEEVPQGIVLLSNFKYLNLHGTRIKELPSGVLPNFSNLQVLIVDRVKAEEVASLKNLETLWCRFYDVSAFNMFTSSTSVSNLNQYYLIIAHHKPPGDVLPRGSKLVHFEDCSIGQGEDALLLPKDVQCLDLYRCNIKTSSLCLKKATKLKSLTIASCDRIQCLLSVSSSPYVFESLEDIYISDMKDLHFLFSRDRDTAYPPILLPHGTFSNLKKFNMWGCPSVKKLFHPSLASNLQNLEEMSVHYCRNLEELIADEEQEGSHNKKTRNQFTFPKLHSFNLGNLPKLNNICGEMVCSCLRTVYVDNCMQLRRLPLSLVDDRSSPLPCLEKIKVFPEAWWTAVELDHPNAKNVLLPLCQFSPF
ncbi:probable disease resistance protein At4g27220 [Euphorbia lathyris]|uniref:probable disease resistance protein At4g27220 n=1 Tax=Euphorbia lathyris TaxID=212925 RepID=UPI003313872C